MATPLSITTGMVLYLVKNTQSNYFKIEPSKLHHMVVILHVIRSKCAVACAITSELPQDPSVHHKYLLIQTDLDFNDTKNPNLNTIHMDIISGRPFEQISYVNIGEPFLVHKNDLETLRHGQAKLRYKGIIDIRNLVANVVPEYQTTIYQEAVIFYANSEPDKCQYPLRLKSATVKVGSLKPESLKPESGVHAHHSTAFANTSWEFGREFNPYTYKTYTTLSVDPCEKSRNSGGLPTSSQVRNSGRYCITIDLGSSNTSGYQPAGSSTNGSTCNRAQGYPTNIYGGQHATLAGIHVTSSHTTTQGAQDSASISQKPLENSEVDGWQFLDHCLFSDVSVCPPCCQCKSQDNRESQN